MHFSKKRTKNDEASDPWVYVSQDALTRVADDVLKVWDRFAVKVGHGAPRNGRIPHSSAATRADNYRFVLPAASLAKRIRWVEQKNPATAPFEAAKGWG